MSFQFEENSSNFDKLRSVGVSTPAQSSKMVQLVMKLGLAKNEKGAEIVLFAVSMLCFSIAIGILVHFIFPGIGQENDLKKVLSPEEFDRLPPEIKQENAR